MFNSLDAYRSFNIIDTLLVEDGIRMAENESVYEKARMEILKVYNSSSTSSSGYSDVELENMYGTRSDYSKPVKPYIPTIEPTEQGYLGLGAPLE